MAKKAATSSTKKKTAKKAASSVKKKAENKVAKKAEATPKKKTSKAKAKKEEVVEAVEEQPELFTEEEVVEEVVEEKKPAPKAKKKTKAEEKKEAEEDRIEQVFDMADNLDYFLGDTDDCLAKGCDNPATTAGYCRLHYIGYWKEIKNKITILEEGMLQKFVREITSKYPVKVIDEVLKDLADDKSFVDVLREMDIEADESFDEVDDIDAEDDQDIAFETKSSVKAIMDEE
ncbi:hypothetical protein EP118_14165 [Halobacteriovorax sp. Y22]|nr:hypothetical protein EP118_14165 [Halobacteriovorax sp. Y22]